MIIVRFLVVLIVVFVVLLFSRFGFSFWRKKEELLTGTEPAAQPKKERNWQNWKKAYQISGAILSLIIVCVFLNWFYPTEFAVVLKSNGFWFLVTLFVLNIVLLEKSTGFVVLVRMAVLAATIAMIFIVGANFVKGGPQVLADVRDFFVEPQFQREIEKVRMSHKDILTAGIDKEIKKFQATAKTRPLTKEELKKVDELEANLARIYSKPEGKKGEKRVLSGVFEVPVGKDVFYTGLFSLPNDFIFFEVIGKNPVFLRDGLDKKIKIYSTLSLKANDKGEVQFWRGSNPAKIKVNIKPSK